MRKDAEMHAEEDKKRKEDVEAVNQADALVYSTEKLFKDFEGKVDSKELETVKGRVMELKELLKSEKKDTAAIKAKLDEVNELVQKISAEMYQKVAQERAGKQEHGASAGSKGKNDENVVDAEYEVEDEDKGKKKK